LLQASDQSGTETEKSGLSVQLINGE
jgi:hypothetical protein